MKKHFTKEEVFNLVDEPGTIHVSSKPWKHGYVFETYVVKHEDSHWKFTFQRSDDEGWMLDGGVDAREVKPQEKTIVEWVEV